MKRLLLVASTLILAGSAVADSYPTRGGGRFSQPYAVIPLAPNNFADQYLAPYYPSGFQPSRPNGSIWVPLHGRQGKPGMMFHVKPHSSYYAPSPGSPHQVMPESQDQAPDHDEE